MAWGGVASGATASIRMHQPHPRKLLDPAGWQDGHASGARQGAAKVGECHCGRQPVSLRPVIVATSEGLAAVFYQKLYIRSGWCVWVHSMVSSVILRFGVSVAFRSSHRRLCMILLSVGGRTAVVWFPSGERVPISLACSSVRVLACCSGRL